MKRTASRGAMSAERATFWWNASSDGGVSPFEMLFCARPRKPGINNARVEVLRPHSVAKGRQSVADYCNLDRNPFVAGDKVFLRPSSGLCDKDWSGPHTVTQIMSSVSLILDDDGVTRHVSHLRRVPVPRNPSAESSDADDKDEISADSDSGDIGGVDDTSSVRLRRSSRERRQPCWFRDYVVSPGIRDSVVL